MKRFAIFSLLLLSLFVLIPTAPLLTGCAGTKSSQVLYTSTEALGKAVDAASQAFTDYEVTRAKAALGTTATTADLRSWVLADPSYQHFADLRRKYNAAFTKWCAANALSVTQTNASAALADPKFRLEAIQLAGELTAFVAGIVGQNKVATVKP